MPRSLTVLLRRDRSRDRQQHETSYEGYQILWPDGRAVATGLSAFCRHGQRLLGRTGRGESPAERFVEFVCFPLHSLDDPLTRLAGHRFRRFFLERTGPTGRLHFLDGTPTEVTFDMGHDELSVLEWIGLPCLADGGRQWLDLGVRPAQSVETRSS
jgi:hypothetical protein